MDSITDTSLLSKKDTSILLDSIQLDRFCRAKVENGMFVLIRQSHNSKNDQIMKFYDCSATEWYTYVDKFIKK